MDQNEIINKLEDEIRLGDKAKKAYNLYLKKFINDSKQRIHESFDQLSVTDIDGLKDVKMLQNAVKALEQNLLNDIETADMANKQLLKEQTNG